MLEITKIIEGGIDLSTQEELPRCIVVSNGVKEVTVPVPNGAMEKIVQLYIEGLQVERTAHANQVVHHIEEELAAPKKVVNAKVNLAPSVPVDHIDVELKVPEDSITSDYEEPPPGLDVMDDEGFQPGEEYEDSGTGAASL